MAKVKFVLNRGGVRQLLKSHEMESLMKSYADDIKGIAGDGYESDSYNGRNRVNASVWAETPHAKNSNLKHNTLLKAMGQVKNK